MNDGCVTLEDVLAAATVRRASLVPETSGYLALAVTDAAERLPFKIEDRAVMLTTEGSVTLQKRGEVVSPARAAEVARSILARLLDVSSGRMPGLASAARAREESDEGIESVACEIEAALIPVNRAAARRALARLARETLRAKEAGKLPKPARETPRKRAEEANARVARRSRRAVQAAPIEAPPMVEPPAPVPQPIKQTLVASPPPQPAPPPPAPPPPPQIEDDPIDVELEPTPTALGMVAPIVEDDDAPTTLDVVTAMSPMEPDLIGTEMDLEFSLSAPPKEVEAVSPPLVDLQLGPAFELEASRDETPMIELIRRAAKAAKGVSRPATSSSKTTPSNRVDELLARFGTSGGEDASLRSAKASLKAFMEIDATPPPPSNIAFTLTRADEPKKKDSQAPVSAMPAAKPARASSPRPPSRETADEPLPPVPTSGMSPIAKVLAALFLLLLAALAIHRLHPTIFAADGAPLAPRLADR